MRECLEASWRYPALMNYSMTVAAAAAALHGGGVIAYPTEAVWGLGCEPLNEGAVLRLLAIKQRAPDKGLILIASRLQQLQAFIDIHALPPDRQEPVLASWPGPHTWILPASAAAPCWITGTHRGIAVRVSAHPDVIALCNQYGGALVSTSANLSGQAAATSRTDLDPALLQQLDGVLVGETGGLQRPSSIRDALSGAALRE